MRQDFRSEVFSNQIQGYDKRRGSEKWTNLIHGTVKIIETLNRALYSHTSILYNFQDYLLLFKNASKKWDLTFLRHHSNYIYVINCINSRDFQNDISTVL